MSVLASVSSQLAVRLHPGARAGDHLRGGLRAPDTYPQGLHPTSAEGAGGAGCSDRPVPPKGSVSGVRRRCPSKNKRVEDETLALRDSISTTCWTHKIVIRT